MREIKVYQYDEWLGSAFLDDQGQVTYQGTKRYLVEARVTHLADYLNMTQAEVVPLLPQLMTGIVWAVDPANAVQEDDNVV